MITQLGIQPTEEVRIGDADKGAVVEFVDNTVAV